MKNIYVPASYIMYLSDLWRFLLCTFGWETRGERGARERGIECILYGYSQCVNCTCNLLIRSQTHCPLQHRTSDISCSRSACHTSLSKSLPHKTLLILAGLEPATFLFVVRRIVYCATGPLTSIAARQLAIIACLGRRQMKQSLNNINKKEIQATLSE